MVFKNNFQKVVFSLFAVSLLIVSGCQIPADIGDNPAFLSNSEQVLAFTALSAVQELRHEANLDETDNVESFNENINSKLYIPNTFLGDSSDFTVSVENESSQGFDKTMFIEYVDDDSDVNSYEFHYNESLVEVDEDERETEIVGVVIANGVEYSLIGTKEEEDGELEYDFSAFIDDENYVTVKYEVENESEFDIEREFEYERFVDKQMAHSIELDFEIDGDEKEIVVKFLDGDYESEYSFKSEIEDGEKEITVEHKISQSGVVIEEGERTSYEEFIS